MSVRPRLDSRRYREDRATIEGRRLRGGCICRSGGMLGPGLTSIVAALARNQMM
jgi:hypothetical protein